MISHLSPLATLLLAAPAHHGPSPLMRFFFKFGLAGLPVISAIDSSFVPLPIPGVTDIMIILYAAGKANLFLLVGLATLGSAIGGYLSHAAGRAGGMAFLEKHVPDRFLRPVSNWMENNAILAVALPAILPPPMPLSPFVLVAGAVHMSRKKFMTAFTISRFLRHALAAWIGVHYGRHVLRLWNQFSTKWGATILTVIWSIIVISVVFAIWKLYQSSRELQHKPSPQSEPTPAL